MRGSLLNVSKPECNMQAAIGPRHRLQRVGGGGGGGEAHRGCRGSCPAAGPQRQCCAAAADGRLGHRDADAAEGRGAAPPPPPLPVRPARPRACAPACPALLGWVGFGLVSRSSQCCRHCCLKNVGMQHRRGIDQSVFGSVYWTTKSTSSHLDPRSAGSNSGDLPGSPAFKEQTAHSELQGCVARCRGS